MPNYRDAETGHYTTAEDAAARPAETVAARHEAPDVAELRRLYSEWQETVNPYGFRLMPSGEYYALAAAAVNALPALLDVAAGRDALAAKVERVRALHRAVGIYDECDCDAPDPATHFDVDDVGLTCNLMYRVCAECCRDNMYQTEGCASYHAHRLDEDYHCPTIRALDEEPQP